MPLTDVRIQFPDYTVVIARDAARFQALTPIEQVTELDEMFRLYRFLRATSGRPEEVDRLAEEEEAAGRLAILELSARHS